MPSYRKTQDGRVCVNVKDVPRISLIKPEKIEPTLADPEPPHLLHQDAGAYVISRDFANGSEGYLGNSKPNALAEYLQSAGIDRKIVHSCLWDDGLPTTYEQAGIHYDVYQLKILVTTLPNVTPTVPHIRMFVTPVTVTVKNAKTADAEIESVVRAGPTVAGPEYHDPNQVARAFTGIAFEPTICGPDGRVIVFRCGSTDMPVGTGSATDHIDIVYSYYESGASADPTQWTDVYPISHAHHDPRFQAPDYEQFPFAKFQLRDPQGTLIPDWEDMAGTYPWIDRAGKNLFFTTVGSLLQNDGNTDTRYDAIAHPNDPNVDFAQVEHDGITRGVAFAGLWSRGKILLTDNLTNDMDYAIGTTSTPQGAPPPKPQQRLVKLFSNGPPGTDGRLLLGYGRANQNNMLPEGENKNTTILDALENFFNYKQRVRPIAKRDVVWFQQNGKHTDQIVFDDYLDPDALIVATMVPLLRFPVPTGGWDEFEYDDGWDGSLFSLPIRLQNASTADHRWIVPDHGDLLQGSGSGVGRVEPAATGGVHGRGLWLEDTLGLSFAMSDQASAPAQIDPEQTPAYVGLFVDCRFADDGTDRLLLSFPDGSRLFLRGRNQVIFDDGSGPVHYATVPADFSHGTGLYEFLPSSGWTHLALRIEEAGHRVTLLCNGLPLSRWSHPTTQIFRVHEAGTFVVGDPGASYTGEVFRGWIDDLKVIMREVDAETACNHAGGTLLGVTGTSGTSWAEKFAASYPQWVHDEIDIALRSRGEASYGRYAVFHDYEADDMVHDDNMPTDTVSVGTGIQFPEGPLFHDRPRPDVLTNRFCLSCHNDGVDQPIGLSLDALRLMPDLARDDVRRQPTQPPATIGGRIPAGLVDVGGLSEPATGFPANTPTSIDVLMLPERGTTPSTAESAFLVDANGKPLVELIEGVDVVVDPAVIGTDVATMQATLDSAQGDVTLSLQEPWTGNPVPPAVYKLLTYPPYTMYQTVAEPFKVRQLPTGTRNLTVTPQNGVARTYTFTLQNPTTPRPIADYGDDFRAGSPSDRWIYAWNADGPVTAPTDLRTLNWNVAEDLYSETGMDWPNPTALARGALSAEGGWPGKGTSQAQAHGRYVMAGYRVLRDGNIQVRDLYVKSLNGNPSNDGTHVLLRVDSVAHPNSQDFGTVLPGATMTVDSATYPVDTGDIIWICLGPNGTNSGDRFELDFTVWFHE